MLESLRAHLGDRYRVDGELGRGGMATVFAAVDLRHHRSVAIKVLLPGIAAAFGIDRFLREIETTAQLSHPHIVPVFDSGVLDQGDGGRCPYFVMPLVEGASLRDRLRQEGNLAQEEALAICRDVGSALAYAHARGVVHRDVKPENILLSSGQALLTDFGIAKALAPAESEFATQTGMAVGTPAYMSPEQRAADRTLDARSDEYALAAVLHEMLSGQVPAAGPLRTSGSPSIDEAIRKALSPAPDDRFPSVEAFLATIEQPAVERPAIRRLPVRAMVIGSVALVASAAVLWLAVRPGAPRDRRLGVALMPFRTTTGTEAWGEALPDLIATALNDAPGLRIPDPWSLWRTLRSDGGARARSPDPVEAERLARGARADRFILGSLVQSGDRLDLTVRIYQVGGGDPVAIFALAGAADSAARLGHRAAVELIGRFAPRGEKDVLAGSTATESPEALTAYLVAREAMRRGLVDSADAAITRSLALDSTFVLAIAEAVTVRSWVQWMRGQNYSGLRQLVDRGLALGGKLPERYRLRLVATKASIETEGPKAAAAWRGIIDLDSTDVEAWNGLSYVSLVYGWQFGMTDEKLVEVIDRSLALDSTYLPAILRRAQLSSTDADSVEARRQVERLRAIEAGSPLLRGARRGLEALLASEAEFPAMVEQLATAPPLEWASVVRRLRSYRPDRALVLLRRLRRTAGPGFSFNLVANAEASLLTAVGRFREVDSIRSSGAYSAAPGLDQATDWRLLANAMLGLEDSATTAGALARATAAWPRDSAMTWMNRRNVWEASWLLASYHATLGNPATAREWLTTMAEFPQEGSPAEWAAAERADVESRLRARAGGRDSATALTERAYRLWTIHTENSVDFDPEPAFRFRLAESLRDRGLLDSAVTIFRSLVPPVTWLGGITPRALYELGLIAEKKGDRQRSVAYFDHALQFWELGGPEIAPWRQRARDGVKRAAVGR